MMALAGAGTSIVQGIFGASSAKTAAKAQEAAFRAGNAAFAGEATRAEGYVNQGADQAVGYVQPYVGAGRDGLRLYQDAIGVNGREAQQAYNTGFMDDPGFNAALEQGRRQVEHSAIFRGRGDSGSTQKELFAYGENARLGAFKERLDRLSSLSSMGMQAGGMAGGFEKGRGDNLANIALERGKSARDSAYGIGAAQAGGISGMNKAIGGAVGGVGSSMAVGFGGADVFGKGGSFPMRPGADDVPMGQSRMVGAPANSGIMSLFSR